MESRQGRTNRPYRKASEYLVASNRTNSEPHQSASENEVLNQKLLQVTRKLERAEVEYAQSREYFESQLAISQDREMKINEQYRKLQSSYVTLQTANRELEQKLMKVNSIFAEKDRLVNEVNELNGRLAETRNALFKTQEENERLRKDCNLAVQLLKCNQSSYQAQSPEQLPANVQAQVDNYKVELRDYNEFINPYASDSDSEDERFNATAMSDGAKRKVDGVPVEFLAEVLKKPENVHMNLEPADYVSDPALHSAYKAHYPEKKLIKPNYDRIGAGTSPSQHQRTADAGAPVKPGSSSPWEMAPSATSLNTQYDPNVDDESAAGAYGAYSVTSKRKARPKAPRVRASSTKPPSRDIAADRPSSPDELHFRAPSTEAARPGISSYFKKQPAKGGGSPAMSSSSSSSKKTSPLKVRGKERASAAETSTLLDQSHSDDDGITVEISHYSSKHSSPDKSYLKAKVVGEEKGSLLAHHDDDDEDEPLPPPPEIDLEWDPEVEEELRDTAEAEPRLSTVTPPSAIPQSDLLLSYNNIESPTKSITADMEALMNSPRHDSDFQLDTHQCLPPPNPGGQLLSEIVTNNPSLSNFLMTSAPPPPQQYASSNESHAQSTARQHPSSVNYTTVRGTSRDAARSEPAKLPMRVDEQIEVIDLDEEPRKRNNHRRRNSFDQAREFGNILAL